jgi:hypothetical protein
MVAADDLSCRALDLAGPVGVDGQDPAELVQYHVMVPPTITFEVHEAGGAAVGPVDHVVGFASRGWLVAPAGVLARLVAEGDQAAQVDRGVVGLALVRVLCLLVAT